LIYCSLSSCHRLKKQISFYYWKTTFQLGSTEQTVLRENDVKTIYTRYFDIDYLPGDSFPTTISPIIFDSSKHDFEIIPVIYIKNRIFQRLDSLEISGLAVMINKLVKEINHSKNLTVNEIQFDCDWTDSSRDKYFFLLKNYRALTQQTISATIRLHQVKYAARTGIPPVDYGVLMYYNMGEIGAGTTNSIYEKPIASKYIVSLKSYPLALDVALPIFSWAQQIREGKVIHLLNKMNFSHFENDSNFTFIQANRVLVKHACFHGATISRKMI
jgi:hypothetical protein